MGLGGGQSGGATPSPGAFGPSPQNRLVFASEAALEDLCAMETDVDEPEMDCG